MLYVYIDIGTYVQYTIVTLKSLRTEHIDIYLIMAMMKTLQAPLFRPKSWMFKHTLKFCTGHDTLVACNSDHLQLNVRNRTLQFTYQWLRDHCRNANVYDHGSHQRKIHLLDWDPNVRPTSTLFEDNKLKLRWDDDHESEFDGDWLLNNFCQNRKESYGEKLPKILWNSETFPWDRVGTDYKDFMQSRDGIRSVLQSILQYGFAAVHGTPANSLKDTGEVVERLAPIAKTLYGELDELGHEPENVSDSSYSNVPLELHTDTSYLLDAMGLQVFHCLQKAEVGGENIILDGFHAAQELKIQDRKAYDYLSNQWVEAEYVHEDHGEIVDHYTNLDRLLKHHPVTGELIQIRFNVYDRGIHLMTLDEQREFYHHYRQLARIIRDPKNGQVLSLDPGTVVFIDNWRVMHGRRGFEGMRRMVSCYVTRADFLSVARTHNLIV